MAESKGIKGKARYKSGVLPYKQMGYWQPDYEPIDTDIIAMFRLIPADGVDRFHAIQIAITPMHERL